VNFKALQPTQDLSVRLNPIKTKQIPLESPHVIIQHIFNSNCVQRPSIVIYRTTHHLCGMIMV